AGGDPSGERTREPHLVAGEGGVEVELAEVLLVLAFHGDGRQELRVEVPRREPEERSAVALHDRADVGRPGFADGAGDAGATMIVGGDRERPAAERLVVLAEMQRGAAGGPQRITPFVEDAADLHVAAARRRHELPDARGAHLRV